MAAAAILDFCTMWVLMVNLSAASHFQPPFQIRCICVQMAELWSKMWYVLDFVGFEFVKIVHRPYSRYQSWCKSVHKLRSYGLLTDLKMAAATILNLFRCQFLSFIRLRPGRPALSWNSWNFKICPECPEISLMSWNSCMMSWNFFIMSPSSPHHW